MSEDASTGRPNAPVIDVHAHVLPAGLASADEVDKQLWPPYPEALANLEMRLRAMDEAGVDQQVVSPWIELVPVGPEAMEREQAVRHVRRINDALAADVARYPDRLIGMAMVPQHDGRAAAEELERAITELGMCGALLTTSGVGLSLADPALDPMWAAAERLKVVLMPHPRQPAECARTRHEDIGDLVGTPIEGTLAVVGLLRAGVLDRYPDLRVCVVHGGGALPSLAGRIEALWDFSGADGGARPGELLPRLYFDTLTHDVRALAFLADLVGPRRLLLGSDYPFATGDPVAVERVEQFAAGEPAVRAAILGGTLAGLLREVSRHA